MTEHATLIRQNTQYRNKISRFKKVVFDANLGEYNTRTKVVTYQSLRCHPLLQDQCKKGFFNLH